jgi:chemotaxis protein CheD
MKTHQQIALNSGELFIFQEPRLIATVLGSCVAVTLFSPSIRLAAICHAMLPHPHLAHMGAVAKADRFRYLTFAIPAMVEPFRQAGLFCDEIEVKMFGGANVIELGNEESPGEGIGADNVRMAEKLLDHFGLKIVASNTGGERGRKLFFDTVTGEVFHKFLDRRSAAHSARHPRHHHHVHS